MKFITALSKNLTLSSMKFMEKLIQEKYIKRGAYNSPKDGDFYLIKLSLIIA